MSLSCKSIVARTFPFKSAIEIMLERLQITNSYFFGKKIRFLISNSSNGLSLGGLMAFRSYFEWNPHILTNPSAAPVTRILSLSVRNISEINLTCPYIWETNWPDCIPITRIFLDAEITDKSSFVNKRAVIGCGNTFLILLRHWPVFNFHILSVLSFELEARSLQLGLMEIEVIPFLWIMN